MKISKNFSLEEFTKSQKAMELKISNEPSIEHVINIVYLVDNCLQKIRTHYKSPVIITSGYRSIELNKFISNASQNSQHLKGQAADFTVKGKSLDEVFLWCKQNLNFDQLINEFDSWIHISYNPFGTNRKEALKTTNGVNFTKL